MFDLKALLTRGIEKQITNVDDYIFMPERIDMVIEDGQLSCVLNSDGRVSVFYTKHGVTDIRAAVRKHPFTAFETELHHGIYDDIIEDLVKAVNDVLDNRSKYFRNVALPSTASLSAPLKPQPTGTPLKSEPDTVNKF